MPTLNSLTLPQKIFVVLPATLYLPVGFVYTFVVAMLIALVASPHWRQHWLNVRNHPFTVPVLIYSAGILLMSLWSNWSRPRFASYVAHYLSYLFLLCFLALGAGAWKQYALKTFYAASAVAATIFYGTMFNAVPPIKIFESFVIYSGGKSILLGILLAVAAGWLLIDLVRRFIWANAALFLYISVALLFIAKGRIGYILFVVAFLVVLSRLLHVSRRAFGIAIISMAAVLLLAWNFSMPLRDRTMETVTGIQSYSEESIKNTSTGLRMQMYVGTTILIAEKPIIGHGIGSWMEVFNERYGSRMIFEEVTPHNEYLLYASEMGIFGLLALLWLWGTQWMVGARMRDEDGERVTMLTAMMMVAALFNAIMRDGTYAMPLMILLAIAMAGATKHGPSPNNVSVPMTRQPDV